MFWISYNSIIIIKKCFYKLINAVCEIDFRSGASDFRTFRHNMVESILEMKEYFRFSKGIFSWVGYNVHYMPYIAEERNAGKTSWSFRKLFKYAMEGKLVAQLKGDGSAEDLFRTITEQKNQLIKNAAYFKISG